MESFISFFKLESRRLLRIRNLFFALLFIILSLYSIHKGIESYKSLLDSTTKFRKIERLKAEKFLSYLHYGALGFQAKYLPPPSSIFYYNSGLFSELYSHIDTGIEINLFTSIKGRNVFAEKPGATCDFSGLLLIFGSLVALFYGYDSSRNKEYLRFITSLTGPKRGYIYIILSRFISMCLFFAALFILCAIQARIENIVLNSTDYLHLFYFWGTWVWIAFCFLLLGSIISALKSNSTGIAIIMSVWFLFNFVFPTIVEKITMTKSNGIELNAQSDLEKWNALIRFENRFAKEVRKVNLELEKSPEYRRLIESFMNNEYKKIQAVEKKIEIGMRNTTVFFQTASIFTPSTFYQSFTREMSGKGYEGVNDFFEYNQDLKRRFCEFYKQKRYYSDDTRVEPFITNDENIYYAKSGPPGKTGAGIFILFVYVSALTWFSYSRYKRILYTPYREEKEPEKSNGSTFEKKILLDPGEYRVIKTGAPRFIDFLYGVLSGYESKLSKAYFTGENKIFIGSEDITQTLTSRHFLYICKPDSIPGEIRAADLFRMAAETLGISFQEKKELFERFGIGKIEKKSFRELEKLKKFDLLLSITYMKVFKWVVFDDITKKMPIEAAIRLKERMEELAEQGVIVLFLSGEIGVTDFDSSKGYEYRDITTGWNMQVGACLP